MRRSLRQADGDRADRRDARGGNHRCEQRRSCLERDQPVHYCCEAHSGHSEDCPSALFSGYLQQARGRLVDRDCCYDAFIAGFMASCEGQNAEYPYEFDREDIAESLKSEWENYRAIQEVKDAAYRQPAPGAGGDDRAL